MPWGPWYDYTDAADATGFSLPFIPEAPTFPGLVAEARFATPPWTWAGAATWTAPRTADQTPFNIPNNWRGADPIVPPAPDAIGSDWKALAAGASYVAVLFSAPFQPLSTNRSGGASVYSPAIPAYALAPYGFAYGDPNFAGVERGKVIVNYDLDAAVGGLGYPYPWLQVPDFEWESLGVHLFSGPSAFGPTHRAFQLGSALSGDTGYLVNPSPPAEFAADEAGYVLWTPSDLDVLAPRFIPIQGWVAADGPGTIISDGVTFIVVVRYTPARSLAIGDAQDELVPWAK